MDNKYKSMCRVCLLKDSSSFMRPLADQETREMLFECTSVRVSSGDNYPQQMCSKCWNKCRSWSSFKSLAKDSERKLKAEFTIEKEEITTEVNERDILMEKDLEFMANCYVNIVKEEPVEYLVGYSLAPEEVEEEGSEDHSDCEAETDRNGKKKSTRIGTSKIKEDAKERPFSCDQCEKTFSFRSSMLRHRLVHTQLEAFECDQCPKQFNFKTNLSRHKLMHTGIKRFECDECGMKFLIKIDLKRHELIHSHIKKFSCDECEKTFKRNKELKQHKLRHSEVRPFDCDGCDKAFKSERELAVHKSRHSGIRAFECDECDKKFATKKQLARHKLVHTGIKQFKCDECEKRFLSKSDLQRHKLVHSGVKAFQCDECDKKFTQNSSLIRHKRTHLPKK